MDRNSATSHFSATYAEARAKFLDAAAEAGGEIVSYENPSRGVAGERLFTDVALAGPETAASVLVLCSATHGVEGFCGSAIQTGLWRDGIAAGLPADVRSIMIHALNPYGFSHLRRVNEDNVDLNRNFVAHDRPYPENPAYDALYEAINPRVDSRWARETAFLRLLWERTIRGQRTLKTAITEGQYRHPRGLFYGGDAETWSNRTLRAIVDRHLRDATRVAFVDIHTGLGPDGHGELVCRFSSDSPTFERMSEWWGDRVMPATQSQTATASLSGTTTIAISEMLPEAEVTAVTLEFGTVGPIRVLRAMQAENWLHHQGDLDDAQAGRIKARMKRVYYPETHDWKTRVWEQGKDITDQALGGLHGKA